MTRMDVRRLAAVDMHGLAGTTFRRRVILAEFILGAAALIGAGLWLVLGARAAGWRALGAVSLGVGLNYVPLALHAAALSRAGALEAELADVDVARELRYYTGAQVWIFVPLLFVVMALRQRRR